MADMFGFDPVLSAAGLPVQDYFDRILPEDWAGIEAALVPALAAAGDYTSEYRVPTADGGIRWISARGRSSIGPNGVSRRLVGLAIDVTQRRLGQEALAEEHARLTAVLEHVPVGITLCNAKGGIELGNPQIEHILRHPIIPSSNVSEYGKWVSFHADGRRVESQEYPLARALADGQSHSGEYHYLRGDGTLAWVRIHAAPILGAKGNVTGGVVALHHGWAV